MELNGGGEVFFLVVFGVESGLFTFPLDSGHSTFSASWGVGEGGFPSSWHVPQRVSNRTSLEEDDLVWFISIRSWEGVHNFFFFIRKELYWLAHQQFFWTLGIPQIEAPLWTPSCKKKKNKYAPLDFTFSVYIHGSWTSGKPYGIKPRCKLGTLWGNAFENTSGAWELDENTLRTWEKNRKSLSPPPSSKREN